MDHQGIIEAVDKSIEMLCSEFQSDPTLFFTENDLVCYFYCFLWQKLPTSNVYDKDGYKDALNETNPVSFWQTHLKEIYEEIKRYPNIALVISIRSGFEDEILTKELKEEFIQEKHTGFAFKGWEAVTKFFNAYSLPLPEVPLLMPEFQNPLFLLLLCKALKKRRSNRAYKGHEGFTYIFEYFVDNVAKTIEDKYGISHAPKKNIWDTVIEKIAEDMVNNNTDRIPEKKLKKIIKTQHPQIDTDEFIKDLDRNLLGCTPKSRQ